MQDQALLLIDIQRGFLDSSYWGSRNNPKFEENVFKILTAFRSVELPVIHVQHLSSNANSPLHPDQRGVDFQECAQPLEREVVFTKTVNSAFIGTSLEKYLQDHGIRNLTLAGLTSDHCVSTSARMAANLGFNVTIAEDALATFERIGFDNVKYSAELVHNISIASLKDEFASILSTQDVVLKIGRGISSF